MRFVASTFPAFDFAVLPARELERVRAVRVTWDLVGRFTIAVSLGGTLLSFKNFVNRL